MDDPWQRDTVGVGEAVAGTRVGGHELVDRLIAADPALVLEHRIGQPGEAHAGKPNEEPDR